METLSQRRCIRRCSDYVLVHFFSFSEIGRFKEIQRNFDEHGSLLAQLVTNIKRSGQRYEKADWLLIHRTVSVSQSVQTLKEFGGGEEKGFQGSFGRILRLSYVLQLLRGGLLILIGRAEVAQAEPPDAVGGGRDAKAGGCIRVPADRLPLLLRLKEKRSRNVIHTVKRLKP